MEEGVSTCRPFSYIHEMIDIHSQIGEVKIASPLPSLPRPHLFNKVRSISRILKRSISWEIIESPLLYIFDDWWIGVVTLG